jgi:hypothetical protein
MFIYSTEDIDTLADTAVDLHLLDVGHAGARSELPTLSHHALILIHLTL